MKLLKTILLIVVPLPLTAQHFELKGRILDEKNQPAEFASVALLQASDCTLVMAAITDSLGLYAFSPVPYGKYMVAAEMTGSSREYYGPVETDSLGGPLTLPAIVLKPLTQLGEIGVTARIPLFTRKPDMLVMNVENSALRSAGTALDVLKKVPGIFIDNNNNITYKGKAGVRITMDGKNTYLDNNQLVNYLQNMSASEIIRVEIVTNPSAKFDASGKAGYINIVTRRRQKQGLNGTVGAWGGYGLTPKYGGGSYLSYGSPKWNFFGSYYSGRREGLEEIHIFRNILYNDTLSSFDQDSETRTLSKSHNARLGFDYFPDSVTSMGLVASANFFNETEQVISGTGVRQEPGDSAFTLEQLNMIFATDYHLGSGLYFKKKLDTLGSEFSFNADFLMYANNSDDDYQTRHYDGSHVEFGQPYLQRSNSASDITIGVGKVDYVRAFAKNEAKLEAGLKSSYVVTDNSLFFEILKNQAWENDTLRSNDFIYKEMINAAYASFSFSWKKIGFQLGLRAENTISDGNSPTLNKRVVAEYTNFFPSAFINYSIGENHLFNAGYSRRIDRPNYQELNPFLFYLDQYTYEKGNPFLKPQFSNAFNLEYSFMEAVFTGMEFSRTRDAMMEVTQQVDSTGIGYLTTENLSTVDYLGFSLGFPIPVGKWFMMENEFTEVYSSYRSDDLFGSALDREGWAFSYSGNMSFFLPRNLSFEISGWYESGNVYGIFNSGEKWGIDCGLVKFFFNKTLLVAFSAEDIFRTSTFASTITYQGQDVRLSWYDENRSFWFRVRYSFGQTQIKKSGYSSGADDLKNRTNKK
ncbi:MAG: TonB dependent receptor [Bacteroidota bacterium]